MAAYAVRVSRLPRPASRASRARIWARRGRRGTFASCRPARAPRSARGSAGVGGTRRHGGRPRAKARCGSGDHPGGRHERHRVTMLLELGTRVRASDGEAGELEDVVIDPVEKRVTHLVVRPGKHGQARLVAIEGAYAGPGKGEVALRCTRAEFSEFPSVDQFAYVRLGEAGVTDPEWDVGVKDVLALPYYDSTGILEPALLDQNIGVAYERVPKGEVELRRSSSVLSGDGRYVGKVGGLIVDDGDEHVTSFVLSRGHLWTRRDVTVPIAAVADVQTDRVKISLSEDEIGALPAQRVRGWLFFWR